MTESGSTARLPPIDEEIRDQFKQFVREAHGMVRGHYKSNVESALKAYMEAYQGGDVTDELRRLREDVEAIRAAVDSSESGSERETEISKTTENRIGEIMADIRDRADELQSPRVRESDVEAAIERNAGASYKTIQRYKKLLQNQRELFGHPENGEIYFVRPTAFIAFVEQGVRSSDAEEIREAYGDEWWVSNAPDGMLDEDRRGFQ